MYACTRYNTYVRIRYVHERYMYICDEVYCCTKTSSTITLCQHHYFFGCVGIRDYVGSTLERCVSVVYPTGLYAL